MMAPLMMGTETAGNGAVDNSVADNVVAYDDDDAGEDGCCQRWVPCTMCIEQDDVAEDSGDVVSGGASVNGAFDNERHRQWALSSVDPMVNPMMIGSAVDDGCRH